MGRGEGGGEGEENRETCEWGEGGKRRIGRLRSM